ncbi:MAG: hypothetical protein M1827_006207 [Pycnora praestabilis]|nr:MAG: hypothetical protein M1827_006207 [Pycnora praestabilis]
MITTTISIQSPHTLAKLPQPSISTTNRTLIAEIWGGASGTRKRKRSEIAVAVNGEGVNIYDVQTPRLITSYAIPPQRLFTCPPCCIYQKARKTSPAYRLTYASIVDTKASIVCFSEIITTSTSTAGTLTDSQSTTFSYDIGASGNKVVHLETVPSSPVKKESQNILAIHENGLVRCLSGDLKQQYWSTALGSLVTSNDDIHAGKRGLRVEHVALIDAAMAQKGLLKSRGDLLALLDPESSSVERLQKIQILALVTRPSDVAALDKGCRSLHLFSVRHRTVNGLHDSDCGLLQSLATWRLPSSKSGDAVSIGEASYRIHGSSGMLYQMLGGQLTIYDLSMTLPRISFQIEIDSIELASILRISSSLIMVSSETALKVFDIKYGSLQATLPINIARSENKKRKFGDTGIPTSVSSAVIRLLSYFPRLNLVVGIDGSDLVAIQIEPTGRTPGNQRSGLLIDSIGRGRKALEEENTLGLNTELPRWLGRYLPGSKGVDDQEWQDQRTKLEEHAEKGDIEGFERAFASVLGISTDETKLDEWKKRRDLWVEKQRSKINGVLVVNGKSNKVTEQEDRPVLEPIQSKFSEKRPLPEWVFWAGQLHHGKQSVPTDQRKAIYALGKIFAWTIRPDTKSLNFTSQNHIATDASLGVIFYPPNIVQWLLASGNFSASSIESALRQNEPSSVFPTRVPAGQVVEAIISFDPGLKVLLSVLRGNAYLDAKEVVHAVKLIMHTPKADDGPQLLPNGLHNLTNGELSVSLDDKESATQDRIELASATPDSSSDIQEQALFLALLKLHAFPLPTITKALKTELSGDEVIAFIHLLRIELASGGWTSRYLDSSLNVTDRDDEIGGGRGIVPIINILNCAIDAIGTGGWVLGVSRESGETEDLVSALKVEVSAALEIIEEAAYLRGMMGELLIYGKAVAEAGARVSQGALGKSDRVMKTDKPITIPLDADEGKLLPLGLRVEHDVSKSKVGAGGEISRRSARDIGRLKSAMVGKYSLERIVI